jgi:23S rRNA pseudouridine1911/1915/1917 synthase
MSRNDGFEYRERLGPEADGQPLLEYLARRYRHSSLEDWRARIEAGMVRLDSAAADAETLLRRGANLTWLRPPWDEPEAPAAVAILYRDDDLLAVAKPAGLPTLPGAGFLRSTVLHLVRRHDPDAAPLHRLGRWTSGLVLCGRSGEARAELSRRWNTAGVVKRYRALASGTAQETAFEITAPIAPVPHPLLGSVHAASRRGKPALTRVRVLEQREGSFLCDVRIRTGRPHQIRVHLAVAGHPLAGDPLFPPGGVPSPGCRALPGDPGYSLHAAELRLVHPRNGEPVRIECSPPSNLRTGDEQGSEKNH